MDSDPNEELADCMVMGFLVDLFMYTVQILGMAVTILLLKRFTPLPFWVCCVLAVPLFFAVYWSLLWFLVGRRHRR